MGLQSHANNVGDTTMLPELLNRPHNDQDICSVTVGGVSYTQKCHNAIVVRGANAVISPRRNAKSCNSTNAEAIAPHEAVNASR